jgi:hypothetical protein
MRVSRAPIAGSGTASDQGSPSVERGTRSVGARVIFATDLGCSSTPSRSREGVGAGPFPRHADRVGGESSAVAYRKGETRSGSCSDAGAVTAPNEWEISQPSGRQRTALGCQKNVRGPRSSLRCQRRVNWTPSGHLKTDPCMFSRQSQVHGQGVKIWMRQVQYSRAADMRGWT